MDCQERGVDGVLCFERSDGIGRLVELLTSGIVIKLHFTSVWLGYDRLMGDYVRRENAVRDYYSRTRCWRLYGRLLTVF